MSTPNEGVRCDAKHDLKSLNPEDSLLLSYPEDDSAYHMNDQVNTNAMSEARVQSDDDLALSPASSSNLNAQPPVTKTRLHKSRPGSTEVGGQTRYRTRQGRSALLLKHAHHSAVKNSRGRPHFGPRNGRSSPRTGSGGNGDSDGSSSDQKGHTDLDIWHSKKLFACPFYKHNSPKYIGCAHLRLTRIRDVKQHLYRRHLRPQCHLQCGLSPTNSQPLQDPVAACDHPQPSLGYDVEGITEAQRASLSSRVSRTSSDEDAWFSVWDIVFPNRRRPSSPYLSDHLEETLKMVYSYWKQHSLELVTSLADPALGRALNNKSIDEVLSPLIKNLLLSFKLSSSQAVTPLPPTRPPATETAGTDDAAEPLPSGAQTWLSGRPEQYQNFPIQYPGAEVENGNSQTILDRTSPNAPTSSSSIGQCEFDYAPPNLRFSQELGLEVASSADGVSPLSEPPLANDAFLSQTSIWQQGCGTSMAPYDTFIGSCPGDQDIPQYVDLVDEYSSDVFRFPQYYNNTDDNMLDLSHCVCLK